MAKEVSLLPEALVKHWAEEVDAHIEVVNREPSPQGAGYSPRRRRGWVDTALLLDTPGAFLEEAVHLLDWSLGEGDRAFSQGAAKGLLWRHLRA